MDTSLIDMTATEAVPAPFWFIQLFKVLGFTLHMIPMGLWFAGIPAALLLSITGGESGRRWSGRLMSQMPVLVALGINFGIVPLLFVQLAYPQFFYSATILMAWYWFAVVLLLIPAYYGVYLYAHGLRGDGAEMPAWRRAAGWGAAVFFCLIGFIFVNAFSLMTNVEAWRGLWSSTSTGGAALGTALNTADPSMWLRWLMMFSLGLMTTAVWTIVDAAWFAGDDREQYHNWICGLAWKLFTVGAVGFAATGSWYVFGTWPGELREAMFRRPLIVLTILTAVLPALPWLLLFTRRAGQTAINWQFAMSVSLAQVGVLATNAISRQVVQNMKLRQYMQGWGEAVQWSPLVTFLVVFLAGVGTIVWMIVQAIKPVELATAGE